MKNPNASHAAVLEKMYSAFAKQDFKSFLEPCADAFSFQIQGKSRLAGKYSKASFAGEFAAKMIEISGGSFSMELHDVMATDQHGTVLSTCKLTRDGKAHEYRTVHVWRFENGKPLAGYEYPRDLYQFDSAWG